MLCQDRRNAILCRFLVSSKRTLPAVTAQPMSRLRGANRMNERFSNSQGENKQDDDSQGMSCKTAAPVFAHITKGCATGSRLLQKKLIMPLGGMVPIVRRAPSSASDELDFFFRSLLPRSFATLHTSLSHTHQPQR